MIGDQLTIDVRGVLDHYGDTILIGTYDSTYDRTSLPAELILTSYFSVMDDKIVSLAIISISHLPTRTTSKFRRHESTLEKSTSRQFPWLTRSAFIRMNPTKLRHLVGLLIPLYSFEML